MCDIMEVDITEFRVYMHGGSLWASGSSLDMYICIHVRDKGIYSRGI
jgi:hypothetical protein